MVNIENYNIDGACAQSIAVLAMLRDKMFEIKCSNNIDYLRVGRYENFREQGYVFMLFYNGKQRNYAVYEHRNSDNLIVLISNKSSLNTPSVDDMWSDKTDKNKYAYDKSFKYGEIMECVDFIIQDINNFIKENSYE